MDQTCSLKSSYIKDNEKFFNYKVQFSNLFPTQLSSVMAIGEFYQVIDGINSIKMVKPHSYIMVLLQSIILYFFLQLMLVTKLITKTTCTIFFSLVLLHFMYVLVIFIQCCSSSIKLKLYLSKLNKQYRDRGLKFNTQFEKDNNTISFSFGFTCKVLFLLIPFFLQLEIINGKNQSQYIYYICYIVISIFLIFIYNVLKNLLLFSKLKSIFIGNQDVDLSQLFYIESLIITYKTQSLNNNYSNNISINNNNNNNNNNNKNNNNNTNNNYDQLDLIIPDYSESTSLLSAV